MTINSSLSLGGLCQLSRQTGGLLVAGSVRVLQSTNLSKALAAEHQEPDELAEVAVHFPNRFPNCSRLVIALGTFWAQGLCKGHPGPSVDMRETKRRIARRCRATASGWPRARCLDALVEQAKAKDIPAPLRRDWPFAVNIFARTRVGDNGDLIDDPVVTMEGSHIEFAVKFDVVVGVMAAGISSPAIDVYVSPGHQS